MTALNTDWSIQRRIEEASKYLDAAKAGEYPLDEAIYYALTELHQAQSADGDTILTEVVWSCDICSKLIADGDGWLTVDLTAACRCKQAHDEYSEKYRGKAMPIGELLDLPESAKWHTYHRGCDPDLGRGVRLRLLA